MSKRSPAKQNGSPLRIAYCITELEPGGAERALVELVTRLDRQQFQPKVYVLGVPPRPPRDVLLLRLAAANIEVKYLHAKNALHARRAFRQLTADFQAERPDIVHSYLFHANALGRLAAARAGVRAILCGIRVAEHRAAWHRWLDRFSQQFVSLFVCVSQAVADFSRDVTGLQADKLVVIPNGVDLETLVARPRKMPGQLKLPARRRFIACVGRLDPQKGTDRLLDIAPAMLAALPEHDLLLVGDGPMMAEAELRARRGALAGRVHVLGWRDDAPDLIAASDALVLPSRWEGMPNVVLEAMALARPVVTMNVEGVAELLGADMQQVVARDDVNGFERAIVALLRRPEAAAQIGLANQERVRAEFSWKRVVARHEELYRSILHG